MESLRNEPVYFGTPNGGSTGTTVVAPGSGGGILDTILAASLLGGRGLGDRDCGRSTCEPSASFAFAQRAADNSSELLRDVAKSESDVKEAMSAGLHRLQIENTVHFSNLSNRLCDTEKEAIKAGYEARLESLQTKSDLLANQNANTIAIKDDIKDFRFETAKNFCETNTNINDKFCTLDHRLDKQFHHVEHIINKGFDTLVEREYKEEIRSLRDQLDKQRFKELDGDLHSIKKDLNAVLCGLAKVPAPSGVPSILDGCGRC